MLVGQMQTYAPRSERVYRRAIGILEAADFDRANAHSRGQIAVNNRSPCATGWAAINGLDLKLG